MFLRFAGCNLWNGVEADRADAQCTFCDTDFVGTDGTKGGKYADAETLANAVAAEWPKDNFAQPYVVCTGGEPLLQLDQNLLKEMRARAFEIAIETNGTLPAPDGVDWICVSPKSLSLMRQQSGSELKLVYPQPELPPDYFVAMAFEHFFLQPMDGPDRVANTQATIDYCQSHPQWRLSLQTHKIVGIP